MKSKLVGNNIIYLTFETKKELTLSFFRLQEFYEGNEGIRGVHFDTESWLRSYIESDGKLTYFNDWEGFNVPSNVAEEFFEYFDLSLEETAVRSEIEKLLGNNKNYYLISGLDGIDETLTHELAHAYFYLFPEYKDKVEKCIDTFPESFVSVFKSALLNNLYLEDVLIDEINAYLVAECEEDLGPKFLNLDLAECKKFSTLLLPLFKEVQRDLHE